MIVLLCCFGDVISSWLFSSPEPLAHVELLCPGQDVIKLIIRIIKTGRYVNDVTT